MKITLYELFILCDIDNTDIGDDVYDWGVNFACYVDKGKCKDYYNKLMRMFATQIECDKYRPNWYSHCFVSKYIKEHIDVFRTFLNEENREGFKPENYNNTENDDEQFFDIYMTSMEQLISGNYSDKQYEKLYKMLGGK